MWDGEESAGYVEWSTPIQHKYVQTVIGQGREAHEYLRNLTMVPQPQNMSCAVALLFNPYMTLEWVAVPCNQSMPNVLNICEVNNSSAFQDKNTTAIASMTSACPMYFLSSNNSCFTLSDNQECGMCKQGITQICTCTRTNFHQQPQLLDIWGLSVRNDTLFIQDRRRIAMLVPKFQYWLKTLSASYHKLDANKRVAFDIIPLSGEKVSLFQTDPMSTATCSVPLHFTCEFGGCILVKHVCDGVPHCSNGEDEVACQAGTLTYPHHHSNRRWYCNSGETIPVLKVCDFRVDCQDGSDEMCVHPVCMHGQFRCDNGQCIDLPDKCDLKRDCIDGTDEKRCQPDTMNAFKCQSDSFIPVPQVHDLWPDCEHYEDENESLTQLNDWHSNTNPIPSICAQSSLLPCMLGTSVCYPAWSVCLLDHDQFGVLRFCRNGGHLSNCTEMQCIGTFKCPGSYCLPLHKVCDSQNDCAGGADEMNCEGRVCPAGTLACDNSTICVHQHQLCDNIRHCPLADDEEYCIEDKCPDRCTCEAGVVDCMSVQQFPTFSVYVRAASINGTAGIILPDLDINGPYLLYLNITHLRIKHFDQRLFAGIPNIRKLWLSTGTVAISSSAFSNLFFLQTLSLGRNPISKIDSSGLGGMSQLVSLNLSHTLITRIESNVFHGLLSLQKLIITNTPLEYIAHDALHDLVSLRVLDIRETRLFLSKANIAFLSKLPSKISISSHNSFLCLVASEFKHSCTDIKHKLKGQWIPYLPTVILVLISSVVSVACTITSLVWHGRLLSVPYSFISFHLTLSNIGTLTHSLLTSARFLYADMRDGSLLAIYLFGRNWSCYLVMVMSDISLVQSALFFNLISIKRCLAIVRLLNVYLLGFKQLKSIIFWSWVLSAVIPCLAVGLTLFTKVSHQNVSRTGVFCLLFTHVRGHWLITVILSVLYAVLLISSILVMFPSAVLIMHAKGKVQKKVRKSKHTTRKQLLQLMARLFLEAACVFLAFIPTVLGFSFHLDFNVNSLEFFTTEAVVFAGIFRTLFVCIFHTFLAADFKKSLLSCSS